MSRVIGFVQTLSRCTILVFFSISNYCVPIERWFFPAWFVIISKIFIRFTSLSGTSYILYFGIKNRLIVGSFHNVSSVNVSGRKYKNSLKGLLNAEPEGIKRRLNHRNVISLDTVLYVVENETKDGLNVEKVGIISFLAVVCQWSELPVEISSRSSPRPISRSRCYAFSWVKEAK